MIIEINKEDKNCENFEPNNKKRIKTDGDKIEIDENLKKIVRKV